MYQFGSVMYKNRVIITFGGRDDSNETIDNIYYLDLLDANSGWKESKLKCPKSSTYNATILDDETVHIVPFYVHQDHYSIPIKRLLPSKLIDQITLDIYAAEEEERMLMHGNGDSSEFTMDYREMMKVQFKQLRNWVVLSVLIGLLLVAIGVILLFFTAIPRVVGIGGISLGVVVIVVAALYAHFYRPVQVEYLLFDKGDGDLRPRERPRDSLITG